MNILFICTGNTCRSPMAEGLMRQLAEQHNLQIDVKSAGVAAFPGAPASAHTDTVLRNRGIALNHQSQPVTAELIGWADLILTMTAAHKERVRQQYPASLDKVFTLKEYVGEADSDIMDPFGGTLELYQETEKELERLLIKLKEKNLSQ